VILLVKNEDYKWGMLKRELQGLKETDRVLGMTITLLSPGVNMPLSQSSTCLLMHSDRSMQCLWKRRKERAGCMNT
jgi:hypothetical protein